jgi:hypothetical protein
LSSTVREWLWSSVRRPQLIDLCPVRDDEQLAELIKEDQLARISHQEKNRGLKTLGAAQHLQR